MKLSDAVAQVKVAMMETSQKASIRRLNVLGNSASCKPGCASCCSRLIHVSIAEALVMYEYLVHHKKWSTVRMRARDMIDIASVAHPLSWFKMNKPCAVLNPETKLCEAYAVRPSPCSVHFVTSDPALCDPWSANVGQFQRVDFDDLHTEFMEKLSRELSGRGVLELRLPIPAALLFAEKIQSQTNLSAAEIIALIASELG